MLSNNLEVGPEGAAMVAYVMELGQRINLASQRPEVARRLQAGQVAIERAKQREEELRQQELQRDAEYEAEKRRIAGERRRRDMQDRGMVAKSVPAGEPWTSGWINNVFKNRVPEVNIKWLKPGLGVNALQLAAEQLEKTLASGKSIKLVTAFLNKEAQAVMDGKYKNYVPAHTLAGCSDE